MKEKLKAALEKDDRNLSWFWTKFVTSKICSYAHFMMMLKNNGRAKMREDVHDIINDYITQHTKD